MLSKKDEILKAALALPLEDQLELAEALLAESTPPPEFETTEEFGRELDRRFQEMKDGTEPGISLDEFIRQSRQILD